MAGTGTRSSNPYRDAAIERKAAAIALLLQGQGVDADTAAELDPRGRGAAAALAGVNPPSPSAWARVVELLRASDTARAQSGCPACAGAMPVHHMGHPLQAEHARHSA